MAVPEFVPSSTITVTAQIYPEAAVLATSKACLNGASVFVDPLESAWSVGR